MEDKNKSVEQLVKELVALRSRVVELEAAEAVKQQTENKLRETIVNLEQQIEVSNAELSKLKREFQTQTAESREIELTLVEEHNLLNTLFENLPDFVYIKDTDGRFVLNNKNHIRV